MPTFSFPDNDDTLPSTPDRHRHGSGRSLFDDMPSTTPAGPPPPSSAASFTPAGAPTDSFLGSSIMQGVTAQKPRQLGGAKPNKFTTNLFGSTLGSSFGSSPQQPLGRSIAAPRPRQPSSLSRQVGLGDGPAAGKSFHIPSDDDDEEEESEEDMDEAAEADEEMKRYLDRDLEEGEDDEEEQDEEEEDDGEDDGEEDMFLSMSHRRRAEDEDDEDAEGEYDDEEEEEEEEEDEEDDYEEGSAASQGMDLMELIPPSVNERARKEAESIFRASKFRRSAGRKDFKYASVAKNLYTSLGYPAVDESPQLIVDTERYVKQLYDQGIGKEEDPEHLDLTLANVAQPLCELWETYAESLPMPEGEARAEVGPSDDDEPFRKASFVANLALQLHHARLIERGELVPRPLPGVVFQWSQESDPLYLNQVREVLGYVPSPASHGLFWQTVSAAQLRGDIRAVLALLEGAGWEKVRKGPSGGFVYRDRVLDNVRRAVALTCDMLNMCPGRQRADDDGGDWEVFNSDWTLFRIQAKGSFDKLQRFAEGKDRSALIGHGAAAAEDSSSLATLARKAESQVPWDIYERLQGIYEVALGIPESVLEIAQDWREATVGLFGWWDVGRGSGGGGHGRSLRMSRSQTLALPSSFPGTEGYFDRLQAAFHAVTESDFHFNAMNPVEVAVASAFEGNFAAVIGFLRAWSLPVAAAVAELASLGRWLPKPEVPNLIALGSLDMEDLDMLGVAPQSRDETEGMKDTTLVLYAQGLAGIERLPGNKEGWELAIEVLGHMDSAKRCEDVVGELLEDILDSLTVDSSETVDKAWRLLQSLGMLQFAEETAETFAGHLQDNTHRYGEALWYYALAHRPAKVRDVLNLMTSVSLAQSTPFPPASDLDDHLYRLLKERGQTLEKLAKQDLEAAQLLGRMLSGYATLRKFYDLRDSEGFADRDSRKAGKLQRDAMTALAAVIASADDNIRGGLYDPTRDAVVSEDFLLVLLGEALPFVSQEGASSSVVSLDQMDTLLKAIEDVETVSGHVFGAADTFFGTVMASAPGLKGSSPHDLLQQSGTTADSGSWVLAGSAMLASQLQRSVSAHGGAGGGSVKRGWDWRAGLQANTTSRDVLRMLRLGLAKDLTKLWLAEADNEPAF